MDNAGGRLASPVAGSIKRPHHRPLIPVLLALVAAVLLVIGWRTFWFLTDDAYIAFRYAANGLDGIGLVWNPPPFRPVEGYSSFLWVVLLRGVWQLTGAEPPDSANLLSLLCGAATLWLGFRCLANMDLGAVREGWRWPLMAVALAGVLANRTFLASLSSGLETGLFNLTVTWWVLETVAWDPRQTNRRALRLSVAATLATLTRPDGLLLVVATLVLLVVGSISRPFVGWRRLLCGAPFLLLVVHLLWRHWFYGDWLPNTYYAKVQGAWPEAGLRYAASFVVEFGVLVWLALAAGWGVVARRVAAPRAGILWRTMSPAIVVVTLLAHAGYYTRIGGDHFEYRVYSHLVLLLFVSGSWLATRLAHRGALAIAALALFVVASLPIPWAHWLATRNLSTRQETRGLIAPLAARFPALARPLVAQWDAWQAALIRHGVCVRHQEHKVFHEMLVATLPSRAEGQRLGWDQRGVIVAGSVGVVGWVLPHVAVLDYYGLNDWVIARAPSGRTRQNRVMAHDRQPPPGYHECFRPNVEIARGQLTIRPRELHDEQIRDCESRRW